MYGCIRLLVIGVLLGGCNVPQGFEGFAPIDYCAEYCTAYEALCVDDLAQDYEKDCTPDCLAMAQGLAIEPEGAESDTTEADASTTPEEGDVSTPTEVPVEWPTEGNTIACRMHVLTLLENSDPKEPEVHCPQADLMGSTLCVDPTEPEPEPDTTPGPPPEFLSCENVTFQGCCTPNNEVFWCEKDTLFTVTCGVGGGSCGWNDDQNWYDCRSTGLAEPAGDHPYLCSTESCDNPCQEQACGTHCGQDCGDCDDGLFCSTGNACETCSCTDKKCGVNECGQPCGQCLATDVCVDNQCLPAHGACMNEADVAVYESPLFLDAHKDCTAQCIATEDPTTCGTQCITEQAMFSEECSSCFGGHFGCINLRCKDECVPEPSPVLCTPCIYKQCNVSLAECSGLPIETPGKDNTP